MTISALVKITLAVVFIALRILVPNKDPLSTKDTAIPQPLFRKLYFLMFGVFLLAIPLIALALKPVVNMMYEPREAGTISALMPGDTFQWIVVCSMALFLSTTLMFMVLRKILRENTAGFWMRYDQLYRFRAKTVLTVVRTCMLVLSVVLSVAGTRMRFDVTDKGIVFQTLSMGQAHHYTYNQVIAIEHRDRYIAPNGNAVASSHYVVRFSDSTYWRSREWYRDPDAMDAEAMTFISKKSTVGITQ